jgi:hypothetical protein
MNATDLLQKIGETLGSTATVNAVFGEPIHGFAVHATPSITVGPSRKSGFVLKNAAAFTNLESTIPLNPVPAFARVGCPTRRRSGVQQTGRIKVTQGQPERRATAIRLGTKARAGG